MLGRWRLGCLSTPNEELLLEVPSKCPDLFSRSVAERAKPESLRLDVGVVGIAGKLPDIGDTEEGGLVPLDLLVEGRSTLI
jgi:hypothetical protein